MIREWLEYDSALQELLKQRSGDTESRSLTEAICPHIWDYLFTDASLRFMMPINFPLSYPWDSWNATWIFLTLRHEVLQLKSSDQYLLTMTTTSRLHSLYRKTSPLACMMESGENNLSLENMKQLSPQCGTESKSPELLGDARWKCNMLKGIPFRDTSNNRLSEKFTLVRYVFYLVDYKRRYSSRVARGRTLPQLKKTGCFCASMVNTSKPNFTTATDLVRMLFFVLLSWYIPDFAWIWDPGV